MIDWSQISTTQPAYNSSELTLNVQWSSEIRPFSSGPCFKSRKKILREIATRIMSLVQFRFVFEIQNRYSVHQNETPLLNHEIARKGVLFRFHANFSWPLRTLWIRVFWIIFIFSHSKSKIKNHDKKIKISKRKID